VGCDVVAGCYALELVEGCVGEAEGVDCVFVRALLFAGGEGEDELWFRISAGRRRKGEAAERDLEEGCSRLTVGTMPTQSMDVSMYNCVRC